jgi:exodeoxyribonuclease VII large subunit
MRLDLRRRAQALNDAAARLKAAMARSLKDKREGLAAAGRVLETLSHRSALARGFALVRRADGTLARRAGDVGPGERVRITFADGEKAATIEPDGAQKPANKKKPDQGSLF